MNLTAERWAKIELLLDEALERTPEDRDAYLDDACRYDPELRRAVEALLHAGHEAPRFLDGQALAFAWPLLVGSEEAPDGPSAMANHRIGPYLLLREIGRGGMGYVFLAERADGQFTQQVALKLLRQGLLDEHITRFRAERHILAALQHPNIARLLDGGLTGDGTPYLVMEYVDGQPITDYCDGHCLSIDQRLDLFSQVCRAVQFAHRHLIVHRDLKPSNILVAEEDGTPQVKLLDFGIAKLLDEDRAFTAVVTRSGARLMTPEYASPEQVKGEAITTATDVYQLGVLLYELLTGHRPYRLERRKLHAIAEAILEVEPTRPSAVVTQVEPLVEPEVTPEQVSRARGTVLERLRRQLAGDLDVICLKALRKEPERRYDSVAALADDVRRHRAGLPVEARGDPLGYRARTFVKRHRWGVAVAVTFALMLAGYALTVTLQTRQVRQALGQARLEAEKSAQVTDFLMSLFEASSPDEALGDTLTALELLERGVVRAEELADQPTVHAQMLDVMGRVYHSMGRYDEAQPLLEQALAMRRELLGEVHLDVAQSVNSLAGLLYYKGDFDAAEALYREALAMRRKLLGPIHPDVAKGLANLAVLLHGKGDLDAAEPLYREALAMQQKLDPAHADVAQYLNNLALLLVSQNDFDAAEPLYREALEMRRKLLGPMHSDVAISLNDLGTLLYYKGDLDAAESLYREALAMRRALLGPMHPDVANSLYNIAEVLQDRGDPRAAEPLYQEAIEIQTMTFGDAHWLVAHFKSKLGSCLTELASYGDAESLLIEAYTILKTARGDRDRYTRKAGEHLVVLYEAWGRPDQAAEFRALVADAPHVLH